MKTMKWIFICAIAMSMTAATIRAQKDAPESTDKCSEELEQLVDIAEMDLLADMIESLLRDDVNDDGKSIADASMPENGFCNMPGMDMGIFGGGFTMGNMGGFGGFPIMAGYGGMGGFGGFGGFGPQGAFGF